MSSPNLDHQHQGWQPGQHQPPPSSSTQPVYHYPQGPYADYTQYTLAPGSYIQPYYNGTPPAQVIAELPAPLPVAPPTTTTEEQLKQDELLARSISQLDIVGSGKPIDTSPGSLRQLSPSLHQERSAQALRLHSKSVSSFHNQRPASLAPRNSVSIPITHQQSMHALRPHAKSVGTHTAAWSPKSPTQVQQIDYSRYSTLPEVVVETPPVPYSAPVFAEQSIPIPVVSEQPLVRRPSVSLDPLSLPPYLEKYRQTPYPPQWSPPPILRTLYAGRQNKPASGSCWLDTPSSASWSENRASQQANDSTPPAFAFKFKSSSSVFRSPKLSWTMVCSEEPGSETKSSKQKPTTWTYDLKIDPKSNLRKSEVLTRSGESPANVMTTYVHALNYDSLRFLGTDRCAYMWVTSTRVSSTDGSRYDTLRHALFVATGNNPNPLYGQIVADHCFWDGGVSETGDILPDEALYIRSPGVDPALVVATLQIMKDWEKHTFREEKARKPEAFRVTEEEARKHPLGATSYWKA
ncbi:uncharacterized protein yc1106_06324 [Curvularia clavata]|uniref:Uncharacterized protein n=1 Tax=Curvularia clavata TaxID=95742 RepID=A0A9Q8ZBA6_CURCL|nr:uncharacterized protein yc1106_06324 [Curvularia clavata]